MFRYANPAQFMRLSGVLLPWVSVLAVVALALGLFLGFRVPPDYQQGMTVTIMFVHVPAAIVAESAYALIAVASLFSLVWRHPLADTAARACTVGRGVHDLGPDHRILVGTSDVGCLLGLGRAAHQLPAAAISLSGLY